MSTTTTLAAAAAAILASADQTAWTEYLYTGPTTGITFRCDDGSKIERMLHGGQTIKLPDVPPIRTLIALKRLAPVQAPATEASDTSEAASAQATAQSTDAPSASASTTASESGAASAPTTATTKKGA